MSYLLDGVFLGGTNQENISEAEFKEIKSAKEVLNSYHKFVEDYQVVVENYRNIEKAKFEVELNHILYSKYSYENLIEAKVLLSTPIIGYLSSSRYFIDSLDKLLNGLFTEKQRQLFNEFQANLYDQSLGYRFIEAFRNYVQHRDLPVQDLTFHSFTDDEILNIEESDKVTTLSIFIKKSLLEKDKKFKKSVLKDLPSKANIIYSIRCHMSGIYKQFNYLNKPFQELGEKSKKQLIDNYSNFKSTHKKKVFRLDALHKDQNNDIIDKVPIVTQWYDASCEAVKKIGNLSNLHKRYITGKIMGKNQNRENKT